MCLKFTSKYSLIKDVFHALSYIKVMFASQNLQFLKTWKKKMTWAFFVAKLQLIYMQHYNWFIKQVAARNDLSVKKMSGNENYSEKGKVIKGASLKDFLEAHGGIWPEKAEKKVWKLVWLDCPWAGIQTVPNVRYDV